MQSCTCRPRQTLAERINEIISKYETCPCQKSPQQTRRSSLPKIFSSPCLRRSSCNTIPCSLCPPCLPCPAITSTSCCPQPAIVTQPSPGPGLSRYISRRNICPALKGCLSLYKRPSAAHSPATLQPCLPSSRCNPSISCPKSRPSCAIFTPNSRSLLSTKSRGPTSYSFGSYCTKCNKPFVKCPQCSPCSQSISTSYCPWSENSCVTRQRISQKSSSSQRCTPCCSACCYSYNLETIRSPCTTPCCYSCTKSSELSSTTPGTCCTSGSSHPVRKRLTVFDDPPYTSNGLEREFSSRFIRLDPCYCETDSSSSLENSNFGSKFR